MVSIRKVVAGCALAVASLAGGAIAASGTAGASVPPSPPLSSPLNGVSITTCNPVPGTLCVRYILANGVIRQAPYANWQGELPLVLTTCMFGTYDGSPTSPWGPPHPTWAWKDNGYTVGGHPYCQQPHILPGTFYPPFLYGTPWPNNITW